MGRFGIAGAKQIPKEETGEVEIGATESDQSWRNLTQYDKGRKISADGLWQMVLIDNGPKSLPSLS